MNKYEAKVVLERHLHHWERLLENRICAKQEGEETIEALKMAIKALEEADRSGNCVLTMFGDCSYNKTGCSDCEIKNKIRKALEEQERPTGDRKCVTCKYCDGEIINKPCRTCSHAWADLYEEAENDG